ncbi:saccharopine dehydrogenase family protein [Nocardioides sp.]|uniref:saccharopine dehydrogenase family protein n=1 Tax=Nocardioides sp. TaxID=35761 RepID=UPI002CCED429|nr:saccharopine dehydrogenase NADP-binding domain-containing protein [Nocardioides sp.]HXH77495.1 saccharopine dehydrogenase NADP-binding domain-containing protein [Nocardioides sp.]
MNTTRRVLVYGSTGHTGRFVVDELLRRGLTPVLAGRSADKLAAVPMRHRSFERRVMCPDDAQLVQAALQRVDAVLNCAGPFIDTALPLARAAVREGIHYLDVTAEQATVQMIYQELDAPARDAGVAVIPAMAFYGGLADLLVTAALEGGSQADEVEVAIGLDRWWPTAGTRTTGARNTATRLVVRDGRLAPLASPAPLGSWSYPPPLGEQTVVELPLSEVITIERHLLVRELRSYLNTAPLDDLHDATTPPPAAVDDDGRSAQQFVVDVVLRAGSRTRRVTATGRDIYAVTAPILVEGLVRLLDGRGHGAGALAPGQAFDAADVLAALSRHPYGIVLTHGRRGSTSAPHRSLPAAP